MSEKCDFPIPNSAYKENYAVKTVLKYVVLGIIIGSVLAVVKGVIECLVK